MAEKMPEGEQFFLSVIGIVNPNLVAGAPK
jgi:hypothetical protein